MRWLDAGVSGGVWGYDVGYCTMIGGDADAFEYVEPAFETLAPEKGYAFLGDAGAGHFAKMVHNGVEYGMLQAYAEGFEILQKSRYDYDLRALSSLWNQGSVVRQLAPGARERLREGRQPRRHQRLRRGLGRGTLDGPRSDRRGRGERHSRLLRPLRLPPGRLFAMKVIAALRGEFGGHAIKEAATEQEK